MPKHAVAIIIVGICLEKDRLTTTNGTFRNNNLEEGGGPWECGHLLRGIFGRTQRKTGADKAEAVGNGENNLFHVSPFLLSYVSLPCRTTQIVSLQGRPTKLKHFYEPNHSGRSFLFPFGQSSAPNCLPTSIFCSLVLHIPLFVTIKLLQTRHTRHIIFLLSSRPIYTPHYIFCFYLLHRCTTPYQH